MAGLHSNVWTCCNRNQRRCTSPNQGVLTAGQFIIEALALGPESNAGRDHLERTNKGLHYAEQCLTDWATELRVKQARLPS